MADDSILLSSSQAATRLGISDSSIRQLKSRHKDKLAEGVHWVKSEGLILWTPSGLEQLAVLAGCHNVVTDSPVSHNSVTEQLPSWIDEQLQPHVDAIALGMIEQRLPELVQVAIRRMLSNPTDLDTQRLQIALERFQAGLGLLGAASAFQSSLNTAIAQSKENLKQLGGSHGL